MDEFESVSEGRLRMREIEPLHGYIDLSEWRMTLGCPVCMQVHPIGDGDIRLKHLFPNNRNYHFFFLP